MGSLTATTPGHTKESDGAHLPPRLPVLVQPLAADELQHEQAVGKDVHRLRVLVVQVALGHDTRAKAARRQHRQPQVANLDLAAVAVDVDLVQPEVSMHHGRLPVVQVGQALQDLSPPLLHRLDVQRLVPLAVVAAAHT
jgi:hypothetical protein